MGPEVCPPGYPSLPSLRMLSGFLSVVQPAAWRWNLLHVFCRLLSDYQNRKSTICFRRPLPIHKHTHTLMGAHILLSFTSHSTNLPSWGPQVALSPSYHRDDESNKTIHIAISISDNHLLKKHFEILKEYTKGTSIELLYKTYSKDFLSHRE